MSPDLSSDRNGSRPPPSYEKTSRTRAGAAVLSLALVESALALSAATRGAAAALGAGLGFACAASGPAATSAASTTALRALIPRPPVCPRAAGRRGRPRGGGGPAASRGVGRR